MLLSLPLPRQSRLALARKLLSSRFSLKAVEDRKFVEYEFLYFYTEITLSRKFTSVTNNMNNWVGSLTTSDPKA